MQKSVSQDPFLWLREREHTGNKVDERMQRQKASLRENVEVENRSFAQGNSTGVFLIDT